MCSLTVNINNYNIKEFGNLSAEKRDAFDWAGIRAQVISYSYILFKLSLSLSKYTFV